MSDASTRAGGRATEAGMSFQAAVATWVAAHIVARMPVGARFGLSSDIVPIAIQCETGSGLDDVVLELDGGGRVSLQCKTHVNLGLSDTADFAKTVAQLVAEDGEITRAGLDRTRCAAVLALGTDAPASLNDLEAGLRAFDLGETWAEVVGRLPKKPWEALAVFEHHARKAWSAEHSSAPDAQDLARLARLFRIVRFGQDATSADWREAVHLLGRRVFGAEERGAAPLQALLGISRRLIRSGAKADREGLLAALRAAGHPDVNAPGFDADIARLNDYSRGELHRLQRHAQLPIDGGVTIERECLTALAASIGLAPLLVTGEPGAGKTGVLVALAERVAAEGEPVVFLSAERLAGYAALGAFQAELGVAHPFLDILANWPGGRRGLLIVDALDASRGGPGETVVAGLLEDAAARLEGRWSVIASIRSFDLRNGRRFRLLARGRAPDPRFVESGLDAVRHFQIPRLSPAEIQATARKSPRLGTFTASAPAALQGLLGNIFNLSIAAELLDRGTSAESMRSVSTQSELLEAYEDERLPGQAERRAARATVETMVGQRRLAVRTVDVPSDGLDLLLRSGVADESNDLTAFAHHVLFDHIAGRFFLDWNNPGRLHEQLCADPLSGLMLGPALRFAMELVWSRDDVRRERTWSFLLQLSAASAPDPVVVSVAIRTAAEKVERPSDLAALLQVIRHSADTPGLGALMHRLARFVDLGGTGDAPDDDTSIAWAQAARSAAESKRLDLADAGKILLWHVIETARLDQPTVLAACGAAARALLAAGWALDPDGSHLRVMAIRMVTRTAASDPAATRAVLSPILTPERMKAHAADEAPWLAEGVARLAQADPAFAAGLYGAFFGFLPADDEKTWLGGAPSRILPLSSTVKQDYEHARWHLKEALPGFLKSSPEFGILALTEALKALRRESYRASNRDGEARVVRVGRGRHAITIADDYFVLEDWRQERHVGDSEAELLAAFVNFLRSCPDETFVKTGERMAAATTGAAMWSRYLGVAADGRPGLADDLAWRVASEPRLAVIQGVSRDAVMFLASSYSRQPKAKRAVFEKRALASSGLRTKRQQRAWDDLVSRFLSSVPADQLVTREMRARRKELESEGELRGNRPYMSFSVSRGDGEDIVDSMLVRDGVDLENAQVQLVRQAAKALEEKLRSTSAKDADLGEIWALADTLRGLLDERQEPPLPEPLVHASLGAVSNAVEIIAQSDSYTPGKDGAPGVEDLADLALRLGSSPYPEARDHDDTDASLAWGNWDVRVYASSAVANLARRFGGERPDLIDAMAGFLDDPEPTVRLQTAQRLNGIWEVARPRMWDLFGQVAKAERNLGVLSFFVTGPVQRVAGADPKRAMELIDEILGRVDRQSEPRGRDHFCDAVGGVTAWIYVVRGEMAAWAWIERWVRAPAAGRSYLSPILHNLRGALFFRYRADATAEELEMQTRAMRIVFAFVENGQRAVAEARGATQGMSVDDPEGERWRNLYIAGDQMIDQVGSQLYFGSGAYQANERDGDGPGVNTPEQKRAFLRDYGEVIDTIAESGSPRTLHYLIETLEYLIDGDPALIFEKVWRILLGPAAAEGYHFESLAADELVKLIERYLADHRSLFEEPARRKQLVEIIELFARTGWPKALKLLYDLPDLLR